MDLLSELLKNKDIAEGLICYLLREEESVYRTAKMHYENGKRTFFRGTIVVVLLCIGAMYLRFRVFGG